MPHTHHLHRVHIVAHTYTIIIPHVRCRFKPRFVVVLYCYVASGSVQANMQRHGGFLARLNAGGVRHSQMPVPAPPSVQVPSPLPVPVPDQCAALPTYIDLAAETTIAISQVYMIALPSPHPIMIAAPSPPGPSPQPMSPAEQSTQGMDESDMQVAVGMLTISDSAMTIAPVTPLHHSLCPPHHWSTEYGASPDQAAAIMDDDDVDSDIGLVSGDADCHSHEASPPAVAIILDTPVPHHCPSPPTSMTPSSPSRPPVTPSSPPTPVTPRGEVPSPSSRSTTSRRSTSPFVPYTPGTGTPERPRLQSRVCSSLADSFDWADDIMKKLDEFTRVGATDGAENEHMQTPPYLDAEKVPSLTLHKLLQGLTYSTAFSGCDAPGTALHVLCYPE